MNFKKKDKPSSPGPKIKEQQESRNIKNKKISKALMAYQQNYTVRLKEHVGKIIHDCLRAEVRVQAGRNVESSAARPKEG